MHFLTTGARNRLGLLASLAAVLAVFAAFASSADAVGPWPSQDGTVATSRFLIPGAPSTTLVTPLTAATTGPVDVGSTAGFPASGQVVISDNAGNGISSSLNQEIMDFTVVDIDTITIPARGTKGIAGAIHASGSRVKLATSLTTALTATVAQSALTDGDGGTGGIQDLEVTAGGCARDSADPLNNLFNIASACPSAGAGTGPGQGPGSATTDFTIVIASGANFPASGTITISHESTQTPNLFRGGNTTEYLTYNNAACGGVVLPTLCITERARNPANKAYRHQRNGYAQPGGTNQKQDNGAQPGVSTVSLHFNMVVKSNAGFFPAGDLLVCDAASTPTGCELIGHNNGATKVKTPAATELHATGRGGSPYAFATTPIAPHAIGSIVTGADGQLFCRNRSVQPGVDTDLGTAGIQEPAAQVPGTSVGVVAVCYTTTQPAAPPTDKIVIGLTPAQPIIGSTLLVFASIPGQPFLSTGGFCHVALGATGIGGSCPSTPPAPFDANGGSDGILSLGSPCIVNFTPGTNLLVRTTLTLDKIILNADSGTIQVTLDTIPLTPAHTECDDPSSSDTLTSTVYDDILTTPVDDKNDDTDRDGCYDRVELTSSTTTGVRDPSNPFDWYDVNHDGTVNINTDILGVAGVFGPVGVNSRFDRGPLNYGPFAWNKSGPDGIVSINDILAVAGQFGSGCAHTHTGYTTAPGWPKGNAPWYGAGIVLNH